jgi:hypothetical protein
MNDTLALPKLASAQDLYDQAAEIEEKLDRMAKENLRLNPAYTWPEKAAIIAMEKLRLSQDLIIVPTIVQMNVADQVERLWTAKPGAYAGLKEAVETETTMSYSEFHNLLDLKRKILPYLDEQGVDALEFFQNYRKSNIREIIPYLKSVITGKASEKESVNAVLSRLREKVEDLPGVNSEDDIKGAIVNDILANAVGTNRMLRKSLRPDDTEDVIFLTGPGANGRRFIIAEVSEDQFTMLNRVFGKHADFIEVDFRYSEARRIPQFRNLLGG